MQMKHLRRLQRRPQPWPQLQYETLTRAQAVAGMAAGKLAVRAQQTRPLLAAQPQLMARGQQTSSLQLHPSCCYLSPGQPQQLQRPHC